MLLIQACQGSAALYLETDKTIALKTFILSGDAAVFQQTNQVIILFVTSILRKKDVAFQITILKQFIFLEK